MRLHQLLATAAPADAVTNQAVAWQEFLAGAGIRGEIFAENVHPDLARSVRPLSAFPRDDGSRAILRYSIWSAAAELALELAPSRLGLVYHNITPGHLLARVNPTVAAFCDRGRRELRRFAERVSVSIADSRFNADELRLSGFPSPRVVPLLLSFAAPPPVREDCPDVVLTVGRIVPNKRLEDVVRATAIARRLSRADLRLEIIGSADGFERYLESLEAFVARLDLTDAVRFRGRVSDQERDTAYAESGVYLSMSEHEGFCAPLLEAAARGLPVVARGAGAVPETLGRAGLVLPSSDGAVAAEAIVRVIDDVHVRAALRAGTVERLDQLAPEKTQRLILQALEPLRR